MPIKEEQTSNDEINVQQETETPECLSIENEEPINTIYGTLNMCCKTTTYEKNKSKRCFDKEKTYSIQLSCDLNDNCHNVIEQYTNCIIRYDKKDGAWKESSNTCNK